MHGSVYQFSRKALVFVVLSFFELLVKQINNQEVARYETFLRTVQSSFYKNEKNSRVLLH